MNDSNSHFNDYDDHGADNLNSSPRETQPTRYEYVFSSGKQQEKTYANHANDKKSNGRFAFAVISILLCAAVSFGAGFGGAWYANALLDESNSLYHENPEEILDKAESEPSVYGSAGEEVLAVSQVVNKVEDSIVVIEAVNSSIYGDSSSAGSGVVISDNGYILTCNHVIDGAKSIYVTTSQNTYEAALVGCDAASDLAVLKIEPKGNEALAGVKQGCSADLVVGEYVVAIGNPLGTLSGTVTTGVISATERSVSMSDGTEMSLLQTDAAINSGNSGGGLFNLQGELIGIVNAKYASSGVEGLAFAIPIDWVYEVQLDLIEYGYVRGVVDTGIETLEITQSMLPRYQYLGIDTAGVYVLSSEYTADLQNKDLILSVNGVSVTTQAEYDAEIAKYGVGDVLTVVASRDKNEFTVQITLMEYVPDSIRNKLS